MIRSLCEKLQFPEAAASDFTQRWFEVENHPAALDSMKNARDSFFVPKSVEWKEHLQLIWECTGIHPYTVDMLLLLFAVPILEEEYRRNGLPENVLADTVKDLRCKLLECHDVFGVWGIASIGWERGFFLRDRFALGRLQYECRAYPKESYGDTIKRGEPALVCHIPSGEPLTKDAVIDSLTQAYHFFPQVRLDGKIVVICNSWMLYPGYEMLFPADSNLACFRKMFHVVDQRHDPDRTDFWRIFDRPWSENIQWDSLPCKSGLQKKMRQYLEKGGTMGSGWGVLIFDGENIL